MEKLDIYEYVVLPGVIRIKVDGTNDPDIVDIFSGIERAKGKIYVDGSYYSYLDNYRLFTTNGESFIELDVVEVA